MAKERADDDEEEAKHGGGLPVDVKERKVGELKAMEDPVFGDDPIMAKHSLESCFGLPLVS